MIEKRSPLSAYMTQLVEIILDGFYAGEISIRTAAERMSFCGVPIKVALRSLAGRGTK